MSTYRAPAARSRGPRWGTTKGVKLLIKCMRLLGRVAWRDRFGQQHAAPYGLARLVRAAERRRYQSLRASARPIEVLRNYQEHLLRRAEEDGILF